MVAVLVCVETVVLIALSRSLIAKAAPLTRKFCFRERVFDLASGKFCEDVDHNVLSYVNSTTPGARHRPAILLCLGFRFCGNQVRGTTFRTSYQKLQTTTFARRSNRRHMSSEDCLLCVTPGGGDRNQIDESVSQPLFNFTGQVRGARILPV